MRTFIYLTLLFFSLSQLSAQNVVENGDFAQNKIDNIHNPIKAEPGKWFIVNNEADGATVMELAEDNDSNHGACIKIVNEKGNGKLSWYKVLLGQRITQGLEKGIYRLSFDAKSAKKKAEVAVYIKQTFEEKGKNPATGKNFTTFFVRDAYDIDKSSHSKVSGASYSHKIGDDWTNVYVDFDMSKVINNYNSKSAVDGLAVSESDDVILNDCYIAIQALRKGDTVYIDNVKLEKIQ